MKLKSQFHQNKISEVFMKKIVTVIIAALALSFFASGCTTISPGYGFAGNAVISAAEMEKTGESSATFLFGGIPLGDGDMSLATAMKNGDISKIATVDTKTFSVLGIIVTKTTIVTGK